MVREQWAQARVEPCAAAGESWRFQTRAKSFVLAPRVLF